MNPVDIAIVGSANLDLVLSVTALPRPGETVLASGRSNSAGGKGINSAVAAARSGAVVTMIAAVGDDDAGRELTAVLRDCGVDVGNVRVVDAPTGLAVVVVDAAGENNIVVASGANAELVDLTDDELAVVGSARVLLLQLEVPLPTVRAAAAAGRAAGARVVLNAAPAQPLSDDLLAEVDVLVVNESEARVIAGVSDMAQAVPLLWERVPDVVVTLGAAGSLHGSRGSEELWVPALPVRPVDTTGAGDTFTGVLAAGLAEGQAMPDALRLATAAAALSVQRTGAVPSIPTRADVEALLARARS